jgi:hypothetical protein
MKLLSVASTANGEYSATFGVTDLTDLIHLLAAAGGPTISQALARLETMMATASQKLDELETVVTEAEQKDALQDAEFSLSKAEVTRLTDELRILKEQQANGELSPENVQRIDALIERIRAIDAIPDAVIPEGPPAEPPAE